MTTTSVKRFIIRNLDAVVLKDTGSKLFATAHGHDIEVDGGILTVRETSKRGHYDAGSDYNPGGYMFPRTLKNLYYYVTGKNY